MSELPVSVVIPTLGRAVLLADCLRSIAAAGDRPAEILLVDQGGEGAAARAAQEAGVAVRVLEHRPPSIGGALNAAFGAVRHDLVLVTHDDCRVKPDWVRTGYGLLRERPEVLFTGRVLAEDGAPGVPSTIAAPTRREYAGTVRADVLFPNNMALSASAALALGGFDPALTTAAEDNDFCLRWLSSGGTIAYEPALVVWHRDWRPVPELRRLYRRYWVSQGEMLGKHLAHGDRDALRILRINLRYGATGALRRRLGVRRRMPRRRHLYAAPDWTYAALTHLPRGVARGLRRHRHERA